MKFSFMGPWPWLVCLALSLSVGAEEILDVGVIEDMTGLDREYSRELLHGYQLEEMVSECSCIKLFNSQSKPESSFRVEVRPGPVAEEVELSRAILFNRQPIAPKVGLRVVGRVKPLFSSLPETTLVFKAKLGGFDSFSTHFSLQASRPLEETITCDGDTEALKVEVKARGNRLEVFVRAVPGALPAPGSNQIDLNFTSESWKSKLRIPAVLEVESKFAASPAVVNLGFVKPGGEVVREFEVSGLNAAISSSQLKTEPKLQASFGETGGIGRYRIVVRIPDTVHPGGVFKSSIVLATNDLEEPVLRIGMVGVVPVDCCSGKSQP